MQTVHAFESSRGASAPLGAEVEVDLDPRPCGLPMNGTDEVDHVTAILSSAARGPAALLMEGEAGIGKTTAWLAAAEAARLAGFRVLSARACQDESRFVLGSRPN